MQKFGIERIKSFSSFTNVEIKPITIFVGKNSSGKSSLIRFPAVLAQTFREDKHTPLSLWGNLLDYGSFDDIIFQHKAASFRFSLGFGPEIGRFSRYLLNDNLILNQMPKPEVDIRCFKKSEIYVELTKKQEKLYIDSIELLIDNQKICRLHILEGSYQLTLYHLFKEKSLHLINPELSLPLTHLSFQKFIPQFDEDDVLFEYCRLNHLFTEDASRDFQPFFPFHLWSSWIKKEDFQKMEDCYHTLSLIAVFFMNIRRQLQRDAENLSYIGPFRADPQRTYRNPESSFTEVGVRGENTSMLLKQAAQETPWIVEQVSQWLYSAMGYRLNIENVGKGYYSLMLTHNQERDNLIDVGYGISQVLPIVTQLYANIFYQNRSNYYSTQRENRTLIVEQPELHLHPAAQAQLADLFIDCIDRKNRKNGIERLLIETHSEHLIRRLQVLVADPSVNLSSDEVAVYYVDKTPEGCSYIEEMKLSETGQFKTPWPSGFFDKSYELTKELMRANRKHCSSAEWRKE